MRRIKKYTAYSLCMAGWLLGCLACTKEEINNTFPEEELAEVKVHTQATGENVTAALLFWDDVNFHDYLIKNSAQAKPYGSAGMEQSIDYYRWEDGETFSTGLLYRGNENNYLHATGYAPAWALTPNEASPFLDLIVNEKSQDGKTDFLCCDGNVNHRGSLADPFTKQEHELQFRHLMSGIRFVGKRDPVMYGVISVNNVKITLRNASVERESSIYNQWSIPTKFSLYSSDSNIPEEDKCTYLVSDFSVPKQIQLSQDIPNYIPAEESGLTLTSCYVHQDYPEWYAENPFMDLEKEVENNKIESGKITLLLDISADFSWYNNGNPAYYDTYTWPDMAVNIESDYGSKMLPGVEYVVYITFRHEGITLQGVQQAWKDGGIHYLPVVPPKQTENE